jgi:hypothetical protein
MGWKSIWKGSASAKNGGRLSQVYVGRLSQILSGRMFPKREQDVAGVVFFTAKPMIF